MFNQSISQSINQSIYIAQRHIVSNAHVLHGLLPPPTTAKQQYNLRRRTHDRQMPEHTGHLADKNFLIRMFFKDSY